MQKVKEPLTMTEMQLFLKIANGDIVQAEKRVYMTIKRLREKLGEGSIILLNGIYVIEKLPEDLIINLREGIIGRRER